MMSFTQAHAVIPCTMQCYPVRLHPGQDIKAELLDFVRRANLQAAFVITCVGSVTSAKLRMADSVTVIHRLFSICKNMTNHPMSSNRYPSATVNKAIHCLK